MKCDINEKSSLKRLERINRLCHMNVVLLASGALLAVGLLRLEDIILGSRVSIEVALLVCHCSYWGYGKSRSRSNFEVQT